MGSILASSVAASEPAGGAALDQVVIATAGATIATAVLLWLVLRHRSGQVGLLSWGSDLAARVSGLPGWAALPSGFAAVSLPIALLGMMWDISLHIDDGRDAGPLANPAHYLILIGLYGIFVAGALAVALPRGDDRPGPSALKLGPDWYAPIGGVLMMAAAGFALIGFPLDDIWHRMFGQDVTLWGPTHLMLIGGAGLTLVSQAILLGEGMRARPETDGGERTATLPIVTALRRVGIAGGLLIGLSTFQAEFDFGVPQFRQVFHPELIALAGGVALVAARGWIGPGGALGAALFFGVVRGGVALIVGPVLGETTPAQPLWLVEAGCVELVALMIDPRSRAIVFGAVSGVLIGTLGFASEYAWTHLVYPLPWTESLLPEGVVGAVVAGVAGGVTGALFASGLRGELPRIPVARAAALASLAAVAILVADGLTTRVPDNVRAAVTMEKRDGGREGLATVRFDPPSSADDAHWVNVTAWQGGGLVVDRLERVGRGVYRSTKAMPLDGEWKVSLRLHRGREVVGVPIRFPKDTAIPAPEIPASDRFVRTVVSDHEILQRESKDTAGWLWTTAALIVLAIALGFLGTLAWGVARVAQMDGPPPSRRKETRPTGPAPTSRPVGA